MKTIKLNKMEDALAEAASLVDEAITLAHRDDYRQAIERLAAAILGQNMVLRKLCRKKADWLAHSCPFSPMEEKPDKPIAFELCENLHQSGMSEEQMQLLSRLSFTEMKKGELTQAKLKEIFDFVMKG
jgi:hypothetical protein